MPSNYLFLLFYLSTNHDTLTQLIYLLFHFKGVFVGNDARYCCYEHPDAGLRGGLTLKAVLENGHIAHKTGFLLLLQHCLFRGLGIEDLSNVQLLFAFKLSFSSNDLIYLAECLFERLQCDIVCMISEAGLVGNAYRLLTVPDDLIGSFNGEIPEGYLGTFHGDTPPETPTRSSFSGTTPLHHPGVIGAILNNDWIAGGQQTTPTTGGIVAVGVQGGVIQKIREIEKMERLEKLERIARNERDRLEKSRLGREKMEKEKERIEKEKMEKERERTVKEKIELDKIEKENSAKKEKRNWGSFTAEVKALSLELYEPTNNALIVDIGCRSTIVSPIYEGIVMKNNIETCSVGGEHCTDLMELLLCAQNSDVFSSLLPKRKRLISRLIKEQFCFFSLNFQKDSEEYGGFRFDKIKTTNDNKNNNRHGSLNHDINDSKDSRDRSSSFPNSAASSTITTPRESHTQTITAIKKPGSLSIKTKPDNKSLIKNLVLDDYEDDENENSNKNENKNLFQKKIPTLKLNNNNGNSGNGNHSLNYYENVGCAVSLFPAKPVNEKSLLRITKGYHCLLPSGTNVTLSVDKERFHCCEVLFHPSIFQGKKC